MLSNTASGCHTFLCKFWHFQMAVSCLRLGLFTPNLEILQSFVCTLWLCGWIVTNPIIYRLVPGPSRFETRQWCIDAINESLLRLDQPWSKSWIINPVPDPSKLKGKQPYLFSLHSTTLTPNLNYVDNKVTKLMQHTSFTWKTFLTPSKNPESTRIDNNKIPVSLTICKKQMMKKFCGNVYPFVHKNTQSIKNANYGILCKF